MHINTCTHTISHRLEKTSMPWEWMPCLLLNNIRQKDWLFSSVERVSSGKCRIHWGNCHKEQIEQSLVHGWVRNKFCLQRCWMFFFFGFLHSCSYQIKRNDIIKETIRYLNKTQNSWHCRNTRWMFTIIFIVGLYGGYYMAIFR